MPGKVGGSPMPMAEFLYIYTCTPSGAANIRTIHYITLHYITLHTYMHTCMHTYTHMTQYLATRKRAFAYASCPICDLGICALGTFALLPLRGTFPRRLGPYWSIIIYVRYMPHCLCASTRHFSSTIGPLGPMWPPLGPLPQSCGLVPWA